MRASVRFVAFVMSSLALTTTFSVPEALAAGSPVGPDVSSWQHPNGAGINWKSVRASGSAFTIIKATESDNYRNSYYSGDVQGAQAAGLVVGAYAFAQPALPISTAVRQARHFAAVVGNVRTPGTLPPILDLEVSGGLAPADLITWTQQFLETLRAATGRTPIVYSYPYFWSSRMASTSALGRYPLWLASYSDRAPAPFPGWQNWTMWQYTSSAATPGINGDSDMSRFNGSASALRALANGAQATSWHISAPTPPRDAAAAGGNRRAEVSWVPSDDGGSLPKHFTVTASPGGKQVRVAGTTNHASVSGLAPGRTYTFVVSATNSAGTSRSSTTSRAIAVGQVPATPGQPTATSSSGRVALRWPVAGGSPVRYVIHRCSPTPCVPSVAETATTTANHYTDAGVVNGRKYAYAVSAANRYGTSANSAARTAAPSAVPSPPTSLTAEASASTVLWRWLPPSSTGGSPVTSYLVSVDAGPPQELPEASRSYAAGGFIPGSAHSFTVAARNVRGTGQAAHRTTTTETVAPSVGSPPR